MSLIRTDSVCTIHVRLQCTEIPLAHKKPTSNRKSQRVDISHLNILYHNSFNEIGSYLFDLSIKMADKCDNVSIWAPYETVLKDKSEKLDLLSKPGFNFHRCSLKRLKDGEWLNDDIIQCFISVTRGKQKKRQEAKEIKTNKIHWVHDVSFMLSLFSNGIEKEPTVDRAKRHGLKKLNDDFGVKGILDLGILVIVVNPNVNHWAVISVDIPNKKMRYHDSLVRSDSLGSKKNATYMPRFKGICKYLHSHLDSPSIEYDEYEKRWKFEKGNSSIQNNGHDCGLFVCYNITKLLEGKDIRESKDDATFLSSYGRHILSQTVLDDIVLKKNGIDERVDFGITQEDGSISIDIDDPPKDNIKAEESSSEKTKDSSSSGKKTDDDDGKLTEIISGIKNLKFETTAEKKKVKRDINQAIATIKCPEESKMRKRTYTQTTVQERVAVVDEYHKRRKKNHSLTMTQFHQDYILHGNKQIKIANYSKFQKWVNNYENDKKKLNDGNKYRNPR